ncbi:MAG: glycoside hydrolase family 13 protein, partial [Synechococcales cyanobacterium RM1_1_8]|nr:glycoside hydrolase family 13 protein [Synechococcales cyanobacterium RM1_1_8]
MNFNVSTPDWVKQAVFYQIFPDRFAKTQRPRHSLPAAMQVPLEDWEAPPQFHSYKGGDLWGAMEQLDYLVDLGITALYFTPIFQSASNHRYHTHDYYNVDPLLGGNAAFDDFLQAAHDRQLKVVLDGVFNHASRGFFHFNDILENGPNSAWIDWFQIEQFPLSAYDGDRPANYKGWWDMRALPVFNHDHPPVREYLMQVGEYWVGKGIDGWRLDVPGEVKTEGFWEEFRDRIKAINPEAYIVGEIWDDATPWLKGDQFDGVMNYPFTSATLAFVAGDRVALPLVEGPGYYPYPSLDAIAYSEKITALLQQYPWEIQLTQLNLLDSHDTARALSVVGEDRASYELALLLLMTFPGAPSIFYGDEVGLAGGLDPDCRRGFPAPEQWDQAYLSLHKQLIALRRRHPALCLGRYQPLAAEGLAYAFARCWPGGLGGSWGRGGTA